MGNGATSVATSMKNPESKKIAIIIAGPTASGKSAVAIDLAKRIGGEAVNADALQLYADLQIVSARPSQADMQGVPHHLFGTLDGAVAASAADWRAAAVPVIEDIWQRGALPIIAGGTGLYMRTLLDGIGHVPEIPTHIREVVRSLSTQERAAALAREDPAMAARLNPNDGQRVARALEVVRSSGRSLASYHGPQADGLRAQADMLTLRLLPDRNLLYARCDARLLEMLATGALEEVARLEQRALAPDLPVMKAVGVPELLAHVRGQTDLARATQAAQQATRRYAKRQYTWFRNQCADWSVNLDLDQIVIKLRKMGLTLK
jgi:tRNA dimethylallyltransferase